MKVLDRNNLDNALHEIQQMISVAIGAQENILRCDDTDFFHVPETDVNLLVFAVFDIRRRVDELKAACG